jgi:hypothetical protein
MEIRYITIAPSTAMVTMLAVSVWPPNCTHSSLKIAMTPITPPASSARCGVSKRGLRPAK